MSKRSEVLDRDAEYIKTLKVARLPGYLTVQMVRFQFKQKDAINAKILKDIKFPMMLDVHDLCTPELQNKLLPMRSKFKDYEDAVVEDATKIKGELFCPSCKDMEDKVVTSFTDLPMTPFFFKFFLKRWDVSTC